MRFAKMFWPNTTRCRAVPNQTRNIIFFSKDFISNISNILQLIFSNRNRNNPIIRQQIPRQQ